MRQKVVEDVGGDLLPGGEVVEAQDHATRDQVAAPDVGEQPRTPRTKNDLFLHGNDQNTEWPCGLVCVIETSW
jgi:hypothetical protein